MSPELEAGCALFRTFHRCPRAHVVRRRCARRLPKVLVGLGELKALIYRSDKDSPGSPRSYIHFMEDPPLLATDAQGRGLYVVGGRIQVTARGIEG